MGTYTIHKDQQEEGLPLKCRRICITVSTAGAERYGIRNFWHHISQLTGASVLKVYQKAPVPPTHVFKILFHLEINTLMRIGWVGGGQPPAFSIHEAPSKRSGHEFVIPHCKDSFLAAVNSPTRSKKTNCMLEYVKPTGYSWEYQNAKSVRLRSIKLLGRSTRL